MSLRNFFTHQDNREVFQLGHYPEAPQTQEYKSPREEGRVTPFPVADLYCFPMTKVDQQLEEIRQEVEEICEWDEDAEPIPEAAYEDARFLLNAFHRFFPMPDIGWLPDGGIGFEWRSRSIKGIATMSIYGDNKVIYGASFGGARREKGTCTFSDISPLVGFLPTLIHLCSR